MMGILNVTPDSFSDGGSYFNPEKALVHALKMIEDGAGIIDIGGESTRPGSDSVSEEEELKRVIPIIQLIRKESAIPISVDTTKARVAELALEAGVQIVNDVSAGLGDPRLFSVVKEAGASLVLMHMRGKPKTMQTDLHYDDLIGEIIGFLQERLKAAMTAGIARDRLIIDPGIGFGKSAEQNFEILRHLKKFLVLEAPVLIGASRKSFLGAVSGRKVDDRLYESLAVASYAALNGASYLRVHDVAETKRVVEVMSRLHSGSRQ